MSRGFLVTLVGRRQTSDPRRFAPIRYIWSASERSRPSSVEIAVCALRFFYKVTLKQPWSIDDLIPAPKEPRRVPVVLGPDEVVRVLDSVACLTRKRGWSPRSGRHTTSLGCDGVRTPDNLQAAVHARDGLVGREALKIWSAVGSPVAVELVRFAFGAALCT
jgi:hypothetical protein